MESSHSECPCSCHWDSKGPSTFASRESNNLRSNVPLDADSEEPIMEASEESSSGTELDMSAQLLNDCQCRMLTSLTKKSFFLMTSGLKTLEMAPLLKYATHNDQILMFLMRLRLGLTYEELGVRFGITSSSVPEIIFDSWLPIMTRELNYALCWVPNKSIKRLLPRTFKRYHPGTTIIIDCTELTTQIPNSGSHSAGKFLVGCSPSGMIMFLSQVYSGTASDEYIVRESGFMSMLRPGMEVMCDRELLSEEDCAKLGVRLNIPPATIEIIEKPQPTEHFDNYIDNVAAVLVINHTEVLKKVIARIKTFKILNHVFSSESDGETDSILLCCAALTNMMPPFKSFY